MAVTGAFYSRCLASAFDGDGRRSVRCSIPFVIDNQQHRMGITEVFTQHRHFQAAGFTTLF
jgi:hypothetical protein